MQIDKICSQIQELHNRYAGTAPAIKWYGTIVFIVFFSLLIPIFAIYGTGRINLSRDSTVMAVEQNINEALDALEAKTISALPEVAKLTKHDLMSERED